MMSMQIVNNRNILALHGTSNTAGSQNSTDSAPRDQQTATFPYSTASQPISNGFLPGNKSFTSTYGMVEWPTLPGMASASSVTSTKAVHALQANEEDFGSSLAVQPITMPITRHPLNGGNEPVTTPPKSTLLRAACDSCHRMKRKCDGKHPCTRCERRRRDCFYSCKQKSGPPKGSKRKLVEAEDDLPENRLSNHMNSVWPGGNKTTEMGGRARPFALMDSTLAGPEMTPSPEARAAAAAAVVASHMTGMSSGVNPALVAAGLRPPYMLAPPPVLPGLSGASVPVTAPLVSPPQYGVMYNHHYPPEVYALYLAELRQRGCNENLNNLNNDCSTTPAPFAGPVGLTRQSPAETTQAAANALAADVAVAGNFSLATSSTIDVMSDGRRELLSDAINIMNQVSSGIYGTCGGSVTAPISAEVGQVSGITLAATIDGLTNESIISTQGVTPIPNERAKDAATSAAASAALAAAVAAAIAENSPSHQCQETKPSLHAVGHGKDINATGTDLTTSLVPEKGSRFDALPAPGEVSSSSTPILTKTALVTTAIKSEFDSTTTPRGQPPVARSILYGANNTHAGVSSAASENGGLCLIGNAGEMGIGIDHAQATQQPQFNQNNNSRSAGQNTPPRQAPDNVLVA